MPDNVDELYQTLSKRYQMPSLQQFREDMRNKDLAQELYGNISKVYQMPTFDQFYLDMNGGEVDKKKESSGLPESKNQYPFPRGKGVQEALQSTPGPSGGLWAASPSQSPSPQPEQPPEEQQPQTTLPPSTNRLPFPQDKTIRDLVNENRQQTGPIWGQRGQAAPPQPPKPGEIKSQDDAISFLFQDYAKNKEQIDRAVTATATNPFGQVYRGPSMSTDNPISELINPNGDVKKFQQYTQTRLRDLDDQAQQKIQELNQKYPAATSTGQIQTLPGAGMSGAYMPVSQRPKEYEIERQAIMNEYAQTRKNILEAAAKIGGSKILNEQLKNATGEQIASGQAFDLDKFGQSAMRMIGDPNDRASDYNTILDKQQRYQDKGLPLTTQEKGFRAEQGLILAQNVIKEKIREATQNGQQPSAELQQQIDGIQAATNKFFKDHSDYIKQGLVDKLSYQIANNKGGLKTFTDGGVTPEDIHKAALDLGIADDEIKNINPEDIKQRNVIGSTLGGVSNFGAKILEGGGRLVGRALGVDEDKMDYGADRMVKSLSNWGGVLGEDPRPDKLHWDVAGLSNAIGNATGQLAGFALTGGAGRALGAGEAIGTGTAIMMSSLDDNIKQAKDMGIESKGAQNAYGFIRSLTNAVIFTKLMEPGKLLGGTDAAVKQFAEGGPNALLDLIKEKGIDGVTQATLKPALKTIIADAGKSTGRVLTAAQVDKTADFITSVAMGGDISKRNYFKESADEAVVLAMASVLPNMLHAGKSASQTSDIMKKFGYHIGDNPEPYIRQTHSDLMEGKITNEQAKNQIQGIVALSQGVKGTGEMASVFQPKYKAPQSGMSPEQQQRLSDLQAKDEQLQQQFQKTKDGNTLRELNRNRAEMIKLKNEIADTGLHPETQQQLATLKAKDDQLQALYQTVKDNGGDTAPILQQIEATRSEINRLEKSTPVAPFENVAVPEDIKLDYAANLAREHVLNEKLKTLGDGDAVQKKAIEGEISQLQKNREKLFNRVQSPVVPELAGKGAYGFDYTGTEQQPAEEAAPQQKPGEPPPPQGGGGAAAPPEQPAEKPGAPPPEQPAVTQAESVPEGYDVISKEEYHSLKPGDPIVMETPTGKVIHDTVKKVNANGEVTLAKTGVPRNVEVTDPENVGYRFLKEKKAGGTPAPAIPKTLTTAPGGATEREETKVTEIPTQPKKQGGPNAIQEQGPVESMLRPEGKGVELPQVGKGDTGGLQKPASPEQAQTVTAAKKEGGETTVVKKEGGRKLATAGIDRESFPEEQSNTRTPTTQRLLDLVADVQGIPRHTEPLESGKYVSWLKNEVGGELGEGTMFRLNHPRQAFDAIKKIDEEYQAKSEKAAEKPEVTAVKKEPGKTTAVSFKSSDGNDLTGKAVKVPGYEGMDVVAVRDGEGNLQLHELATGMKIADVAPGLDEEAAIASVANQLNGKRFSVPRLMEKIYQGDIDKHGVHKKILVNPSPAYQAYKEQRIAEEQNVPFMYSEEERAEIQKMIDQGKQEGIEMKMLENFRDRRQMSERYQKALGKPSVQSIRELFDRLREQHKNKQLRANQQPLPPGSFEVLPKTREAFLEELRETGVTYPGRFEKLDEGLKERVLAGWQQGRDIRNKYGYWPDWMGDIGVMMDTIVLLADMNARNEKRKAKVPAQERKLERTIKNVDEWHKKEFGAGAAPPAPKEQAPPPAPPAPKEEVPAETKFGAEPPPAADKNASIEQRREALKQGSENRVRIAVRGNDTVGIGSISAMQGPSGRWYSDHFVIAGGKPIASERAMIGKGNSYPTREAAMAAAASEVLDTLNSPEFTAKDPLIEPAKQDLQKIIDQYETGQQQAPGGPGNAPGGGATKPTTPGISETFRPQTKPTGVPGPEDAGTQTGGGQQTGEGPKQESTSSEEGPKSKTEEERIREEIRQRKKAFRESLKKDRGSLGANKPPISAESMRLGIELLASYAKLGWHKFSLIARDLIGDGDMTKEDIDGLRAVYGAEYFGRDPVERAKMESPEKIDAFYEKELPDLLNPPKIPDTIKIGKEGREAKLVGFNIDGLPLYEDNAGIRSVPAEKGSPIIITEPVNIVPTRSGVEATVGGRSSRFMTTEEIEQKTLGLQEKPVDLPTTAERSFMDYVIESIGKREKLTIVDLRKKAGELGLEQKDTYLQDLAETAVVDLARYINQLNLANVDKFNAVVESYTYQPTFNMRSSERVEKQQYSTPSPISFLGGLYVDHKGPDYVLEPSAGNGLMTIAVSPGKMHVNEIDPVRLANLLKQGYATVTNQDGTKPFDQRKYGGILSNPPFGSAPERVYDGYRVSGLDEQMIINALDSMKDDGRAALIMGGHNSYDEKGRLKSDRVFFNYLYNHYHVADVINIDGKLYAKQGTTFPIRMILIDGRKSMPNGAAPLRTDADDPVRTFNDLYDRVTKAKNISHETLLQPPMDGGSEQGGDIYGPGTETSGLQGGSPNVLTGPGEGTGTEVSRPGRKPGTSDSGSTTPSGRGGGGRSKPSGRGGTKQPTDANVDTSVSLPGGKPGGAGGARDLFPIPKGGGEAIPRDELKPVPTDIGTSGVETGKVPYNPVSRGKYFDSVIPTQMASETAKELNKLQDKVGDVDEYIRKELRYPDKKTLYDNLGAEQIDAIAMSIQQVLNGKGMIVGDMTGIGKGRIAAAMIRWGIINGLQPIFITEKANLFSDLYRDMIATGSGHVTPFIINDKSSDQDPTITDAKGNILYKPQPPAVKNTAFAKGELPEGTYFALATYSQFSPSEETKKKAFLRAISQSKLLITDESHNMSGSSNTGAYFQDILEGAKGVTYLSATFAKRPENMPVYAHKTDMAEAGLTHQQLVDAIKNGGVALQEVISAQLADSGQMLRRERDFSDVVIRNETLDHLKAEHQKKMDATTAIMRRIIKFQKEHIDPMISTMDDEVKGEGRAGGRKGTSNAGVDNTAFASKVFQVVNQLLFAVKADAVADAAIQTLKEGRKPVIAFENTMESFLTYAGLKPGDTISKGDFSLSLLRGLDGVLRYTVTDAKGNSDPRSFSVDDLSEEGQKEYAAIRAMISKSATGIPISPVDHLIKRIKDAGYSVKEITGRSLQLEYDDKGGGLIVERTERDKNKMVREFNDGLLDVLLLNRSGSTGLSIHASKDFEDKRQRVMIMAQLQLDINQLVQLWGRIDRTGQVVRGEYLNMATSIPAEKRLLMMSSSKLKSLNANTSSAQKQKTSESELVDFLNHHGDKIVFDYLVNNADINAALGDPFKFLSKSQEEIASMSAPSGAATKVTGRVALLPTEEQETFYNNVTEMYNRHIDSLNSMNANDLEVKSVELAAKTLSTAPVIIGKGGDSPFGQDTVLEKVEANVLVKPLTKDELEMKITKSLAGKTQEEVAREHIDHADEYLDNFIEEGQQQIRERADKKRSEAHDWVEKQAAKATKPPTEEQRQAMYQDRMQNIALQEATQLDRFVTKERNIKRSIIGKFQYFRIGRAYGVPTDLNADVASGYVPGMFLGFDIGKSTQNIYRPSNIIMRFATPMGSMREISVPLSKTNYVNAVESNTNSARPSEFANVRTNWSQLSHVGDRQTRYILTGNILQGMGYAPGQLVSYTTDQGAMKKGILLHERFDPTKHAVTTLPIAKAEEHLRQTGRIKAGKDDEVEINRGGGGWTISVPASKKSGGKYYLNQGLRDLVSGRDFRQSGKVFIAKFDDDNLSAVLNLLQKEFNLQVKIPKLNLNTMVLPQELQTQHDSIVYKDKGKQMAQGAAQAQYEAKGIADIGGMSDIRPRTFAQDFAEQAVTSHIGYEIQSHRDVAELFSLYRSPHIEKTHLVFVKDGVIVGNHSITSNSPIHTPMWEPSEVANLATGYGADEVFIVHNHPSGDPTPSDYDHLVTNTLAARLPEYDLNFRGHVILNGNRYVFIDEKGKQSSEQYKTPKPELFTPRHQLSEDYDTFHQQAVDTAHYILKNPNSGERGIVYVDPLNRISGYDLIAPGATVPDITDMISRGMVPNGASNYYLVGDDPHPHLPSATMPTGMLGEVSLNGGVRGADEFKVAPQIEHPGMMLQAKKKPRPEPQQMQGEAPFEVELEKTARVKQYLDKTKRTVKEYGLVGGGIPKELRDIKERELGNIDAIRFKARYLQKDFTRAIRQAYGKKRLSPEDWEVVDQALRGDKEAKESLAQPVREAVQKMRDQIDDLSRQMMETGLVPKLDEINETIDQYLRMTEEAGIKANEKYLALLRAKQSLAKTFENKLGSYLNRAYMKYLTKNWREIIPQHKVDAGKNYLYNEALLHGKELTQEQVKDMIEEIVQSDSIDHIMTGSKFANNFNILKKMKDIPEPIRDLMGEVKDPEWNFVNTVAKQAALLERHKFLQDFFKAGNGKYFGTKKDADKGWTEHVEEPAWGPLGNIWTSPELKSALKEWDKSSVDEAMGWKAWRDINGMAKASKTILSVASEMVNMTGNVSLTAFNGNFSPKELKTGWLAIKDIFNQVTDQPARDYLEKLHRLRVVGTSLPLNEIRGMVNDISETLPELEGEDPSKWLKVWKKLVHMKDKAGELYGATDDIYKIMTFEMEKAKLKKAYEKSGVPKTEEQLDQEAAEKTLAIMPTFAKVPKAIQKTSQYGVYGLFTSYPSEIFRTVANSMKLAYDEINSDNPEIRKMGYKRMMAQASTIAFPHILTAVVGLLAAMLGYGVSSEEKEAVRKMLPEYYRDTNFTMWKKGGKYYIWLHSGWDGHTNLREIVNAGIHEGPGAALEKFAEPYAQPAIPIQKMLQHAANKDQYGQQITYAADEPGERNWKIAKHYGDMVVPQTAVDIARPTKQFIAGEGEKGAFGVMKFLTGQKVIVLDPAKDFPRMVKELQKEKSDIRYKARRDFTDGTKTKEETDNWFNGRLEKLNERGQELDEIKRALSGKP